jgi:membrane protein
VAGQVGRRIVEERLPLLSAGVAFFAVLSIAPVLVTALSVYGAVNTPEQALAQLAGWWTCCRRSCRTWPPTS